MNDGVDDGVAITVIVTVDGETDLEDLFGEYQIALDDLDRSYEVFCMVNQEAERTLTSLHAVAEGWPRLLVLPQRPWRGEDAAFAAALSRARGDLILALPGWREVNTRDIGHLVESLGKADMAVGCRGGEEPSTWRRFRARIFQGMLRRLFGSGFKDPFCPARIGRREVFEAVGRYGVRRHFLPLIAAAKGYVVRETTIASDPRSAAYKFKPTAHAAALVDVLALYVTLHFLDRPLRFFGLIGLPLLVFGSLATLWLVVERLALGVALADRPALVLSVLMVVLGVQVLALGLIGEIIVFNSARRPKKYDVEIVISRAPEARSAAEADASAATPARQAVVG